MDFSWKGVFPALTTKFTPEGKLDIPLFEKNLMAQVEAGVHGVILGGTLGEASVLETKEKEIIVRSALGIAGGRIPVILNIAEGSLDDAIRQVNLAGQWGVNGLMILPAMRYKTDHRETVNWFTSLANSTGLPIMIYNNPVDYKTEVTPDMFDELQSCNNILAIKDSTRDLTNITRMRNRFDDRFKLFCGVDTIALESFCLGADGWVAGLVCAFPRETVALFELARTGRLEQALNLYRWFMPLLELDIHPKLVQYIKLAESETGLGSEWVRAPRLSLVGEERERILKVIRDAINNRPMLA